jgi:hypothetical protein
MAKMQGQFDNEIYIKSGCNLQITVRLREILDGHALTILMGE